MTSLILKVALLQALVPSVPVLGALDRQALPARGCAAYLWNATDRSFAVMASADPATLRLRLDGKVVDLPRTSQVGQGGYGLAATTTYQDGATVASLQLSIAAREDLTAGAIVSQATLTLRREGTDELVQPLAGLIGCAAIP